MNRTMLKHCMELLETGRAQEAYEHIQAAYRVSAPEDTVVRLRALAEEVHRLSYGALVGPTNEIRKHAQAIENVRVKWGVAPVEK